MKVTAQLNNLRITPRKVRLLLGIMKGFDVDEALLNLGNAVKKSSPILEKCLKSAVANAENNFGLDRENLYVYDIQIGDGTRLKRWLPKAYGRATPLIKRNCHVKLVLEERVEGKNRKSKEQLEKERKEREEKRKKAEDEMMKEREANKEEKAAAKETGSQAKKEIPEKEGRRTQKSGWMNKVFRRKSM